MDITEHLRTFMAQQTGLYVTPLLEHGLVAATGPGGVWALTEAGHTLLHGEDLPTRNPGDWVKVEDDHTQAADEDRTDSFLRKHVKPGALSEQIGDSVNHPAHYTQGGIECIDAIKAALTEEEFRGYCKGNALKYVWRERHKGGVESLAKAAWYLDRLSNEHR